MSAIASRRVVAAVPEMPHLYMTDPLPDGVEMRILAANEAHWKDDLSEIEFIVVAPSFGKERLARGFHRMERLRVIQSITAGIEWLTPMAPEGVTICDANGVHDVGVAEWAVAMLLALAREFPMLRDEQNARRWHGVPVLPSRTYAEVHGTRVLLLGYGNIAQGVERRLEPFGVEFVRVARTARDGVLAIEDLDTVLGEVDSVMVALPLTSQTHGLVDAAFLRRLRPGATLINMSRGPVVDTAALQAALESGQLGAAGLDVTDPEPLPREHPLWGAPNVFITPHVSGRSERLYERARHLVVQQLERYVAGRPLVNVVEGEY